MFVYMGVPQRYETQKVPKRIETIEDIYHPELRKGIRIWGF